jgi:hypothetical protein
VCNGGCLWLRTASKPGTARAFGAFWGSLGLCRPRAKHLGNAVVEVPPLGYQSPQPWRPMMWPPRGWQKSLPGKGRKGHLYIDLYKGTLQGPLI